MQLNCRSYCTSEMVSIQIRNNNATVMRNSATDESTSLLFAPAFFDLQINGQRGIDFSQPSTLTCDGVCRVVQALWEQGVAYFLPTVVTGGFESTRRSLQIIASAARDEEVARSIPGIHLEGPYISPEDGPRGAHPKEHVRFPSWNEFTKWQEAASGMIRLVTLAPELPGAIGLIENLRKEKILVAIGHTNASSLEIASAVEAGAMLSTHLGNGAHATIRRHPNYIWDQLAHDNLCASLIVDGALHKKSTKSHKDAVYRICLQPTILKGSGNIVTDSNTHPKLTTRFSK